jgi:hypothetical protein
MIEIYLNPDNETLFEGNEEEYVKAVHSAKELLKVQINLIFSIT